MIPGLVPTKVAFSADRRRHAQWSQALDRLGVEVFPRIRPSFRIGPEDKIFTIGSCFARNIEEHVSRLGYNVPMLRFAVPEKEWDGGRRNGILNKYTPTSILQELAWAAAILERGGAWREEDADPMRFDVDGERAIDLNLAQFRTVSRARYLERRREVFEVMREAFTADVTVITLGQIECWYDLEKERYIQEAPAVRALARHEARFAFKTLEFSEAIAAVNETIALLRRFRPEMKFLVTTSPVPMGRTFNPDDVITENSYGKSLLRTVAGQVARTTPGVDYFPSYESVMLSKTWAIWAPDKIHVTDAFVGKIVGGLVDAYFPDSSPARVLLQRSYTQFRARDYPAALASIREALTHAPEDFELREQHAAVLAQLGETVAAESEYRALLRERPERADLGHRFALLLARGGRDGEALAQAAAAVKRQPDNAEFRVTLSDLLAKVGRFPESAVMLEAAIALSPARAQWHRRLSMLRVRLKDWPGALATSAEAVRLAPQVVEFRLHQAELLARSGNFAEAEMQFRRAIDQAPAQAEPHFRFSVVLAAHDRMAIAMVHAREAQRRAPEDARIASWLEQLHRGEASVTIAS